MTTREALPPAHDAIVARLVADARPVRRLWPPYARLAAWCAVVAAVLAIAALVGLRTDLDRVLRLPLYEVQIALFVAAGVAAAAAALRFAVPGRAAGSLAVLALLLAIAACGASVLEPPAPGGTLAAGVRCAACIAMFGTLPWLGLALAVRRAAPLDGRAAGAYVGAAAFLIGAAAVRLACPIDDGVHMLAWHVVPVLGWTAVSSLVAAGWLVQWGTPRLAERRSPT